MTIPIVVVDDDEVDRYLVKRTVKSLGIDARLIQYADGDQFIEVVRDNPRLEAEIAVTPPPILVLLDINMPRMSGFDVLEKLMKELDNNEHFVFVTMYSSSNHAQDRDDAMKYPFVKDYIVKPVTAEKLKELLRILYPDDSGLRIESKSSGTPISDGRSPGSGDSFRPAQGPVDTDRSMGGPMGSSANN